MTFFEQKQQKSRVQARARPATLSAFPNLTGGHYHHDSGMPLWPAGDKTALSIDFLSFHRPLWPVYPIGCSGKGLSKQPEGPTTGMGWSHQILLPCQTTKRATFGALSGTGKESAASESRRASSFVAPPRRMPLSGMPGRDWSDGIPNVACYCVCNLTLTNPYNHYLDHLISTTSGRFRYVAD